MGSISCELSLDYKPRFAPKSVTHFLEMLSNNNNVHAKSSELNGYINMYEEELRKIDGLKRELPLCLRLLKDVIIFLKEEVMKLKESMVVNVEQEPGLDGFVLFNKDEIGADENEVKIVVNEIANEGLFQKGEDKREERTIISFETCPTLYKPVLTKSEDREVLGTHSVFASGMKSVKVDSECNKSGSALMSKTLSFLRNGPQPTRHQQQTCRKQRRCWSQDLHQRFVNALQQLGGSQATPKQIRELMQVDGLTNDEVKSHLQKYRLHSRRHPSGAPTSSPDQSTVVMGELCSSQDQYSESFKHRTSNSRSPYGPLELSENYEADDTMEEHEDERAESCSWKNCNIKPAIAYL